MYLILATFASLWTQKYQMAVGIAGLHYIALGLGFTIGVQVSHSFPWGLARRKSYPF